MPSVLIVGAGFGGLAAALELKRHGHHDITILEKGDGVGGVWRENTYPGAACDIPSVLYSYSFAPNPHWPSRYSGHADIRAYVEKVARQHGVFDKIRFGVEVESADFDETTGRWAVTTTTGERFEADVFVPALGQLSRPVTPAIPGKDTFAGAQFHSAEWNHGVDLTGKRVAVVGTGASAIQIVPGIQPSVGHLTLFQRSAPYVVPKYEREFSEAHHRMFVRLPFVQKLERLLWWSYMELATLGMTGNRLVIKCLEAYAGNHLKRQVKDRELRRKLTPDYPAGCKRGLLASNYYPALAQPNVSVETANIAEITETGIRTKDGTHHDLDAIVYCTGFAATDFLAPLKIRGLGGKDLRETWTTGARAYLGITVPGYPNLLLMYGPNTNVGAGSIIYMHESQARYLRLAVDHLTSSGASYLDVRADVEDRFDAEVQGRMGNTVWSRCSSWYVDANGRVATNWPGRVSEYRRRTATFDPTEYDLVPAASAQTLSGTQR